MIPAALNPLPRVSPCSGAPSVATVTNSDTLDDCVASGGGDGWRVSVTFTISGPQNGFHFEIWDKRWKDGESEPGAFLFRQRVLSPGTYQLEVDPFWGSDGAGTSQTRRRRHQVRVVPAESADGAGPFCHLLQSSVLVKFGAECTGEEGEF